MARYIDLEELEKRINENIKPETLEEKALIEWCKDECIRQAYAMPVADVVPKSEVVNIFDELMKEAREIADRYEKSANETSYYDYARIEYRGCQMGALLVLFKIAELKKKHTEVNDDKTDNNP